MLEETCEITVAGNHRLKAVATGIISGYIIDETGVRPPVRLPVVVGPTLAAYLLCSERNGGWIYKNVSTAGAAAQDQRFLSIPLR